MTQWLVSESVCVYVRVCVVCVHADDAGHEVVSVAVAQHFQQVGRGGDQGLAPELNHGEGVRERVGELVYKGCE